jgi:acetolactate synthase-1/2/3 large subunit
MRARAAGSPVLIIAGDEVARANARRELALLVDVLGASVAVAPDAKDVFDNRDPRFAGVAGVMGHPAVRQRLTEAAVCVLVGTRLPLMTRGGLEPTLAEKTVVSIGLESPFVPATVSVVTRDLGAALGRLAGDLVTHDRAAEAPPPTPPNSLPSAGYTGAGISYRDAVAAIESVLPADADVFVDAGNTGASAIHHLPAPKDGRFVVALGMGGMGYTFGAAIGAAFARGRRTYVIAGDGAFFMHGMEVHTALEHDLPVTFIVFNNDAHAMCVTREQIYYGGTYSYNRFRHAEIGIGMAAMFPGLRACHAKTTDELAEVLAETNASGSPAFVSIDCDPDEIPPFQPFLKEIGSDEERVDVG